MNIKYDSSLNNFKVHLEADDYLSLLKNEVAYGKVMQVFSELLNYLASDLYKYSLWARDLRYDPDKMIANMKDLLYMMGEEKYETVE